ncbi:probable flavin-containing monooxygenase 1, partial [Amborella trichopoda]|uniref:probable flavin-containing monooxygenase 1 n=1 Tax=Amborella trichopoda TaxID=13333 RepID=UPI0009BC9368
MIFAKQVHQVEFVVLCIGRFGDVPKLPLLPQNNGPQVFKGEVMHAKDYSELSSSEAAYAVRGKRVAVVGFQKSALDIAAECARVNGKQIPCNVILRAPHWNVPHYLPWGVHLAYLYCTRFSELLVHKPQEGFLLSLLATLLSPVVNFKSK